MMNEYIELLKSAKKPVLLCSFGKDSMVLLYESLKVRNDIDIIYIRQPYFSKKQTFANKIIADLNLRVYQYNPSFSVYTQEEDYFDVFDLFYLKEKMYFPMAKGCTKTNDNNYACVIDLLEMPKIPSITFEWDLFIAGQKNYDNLNGRKYNLNNNIKFCYPIKDWTDKQVWEYIHSNNIPYNKERYDDKNDDYNDDKIPTCNNCLDYRYKNNLVYCPKIKKEIESIAVSEDKCKSFLNMQITNGYNISKEEQ